MLQTHRIAMGLQELRPAVFALRAYNVELAGIADQVGKTSLRD